MPQAIIPIQTITVGAGGTSSIVFNNIPQNYTDLKIVLSTRSSVGSNAWSDHIYSFNGTATNSNMTVRVLYGNSNGIASSTFTTSYLTQGQGNAATAGIFSNTEVYIPNYRSSVGKIMFGESSAETNAAAAINQIGGMLWNNLSPITSIAITDIGGGNFVQHSTATIYGIGAHKASGGTITADSKYTYHTFTSSGIFSPIVNISNVEILAIAGGGGGGTARGGGGGAGGVLYRGGQKLISGNPCSVIVGAGGAAGSSPGGETGTNGGNGGDSQFLTMRAFGGGGGQTAAVGTATPPAGGSGGGASLWNFSPGGLGVVGQGFNGGGSIGWTTSGHAGGGGGSAGTPATSTSTSAGHGGPGTNAYTDWAIATGTGVNYQYAGGGGGGCDGDASVGIGSVGGGNGGRLGAGTAASANTGSGGGGGGRNSGSGETFAGAAGGSGIVIIRYPN